MWRQGRGDNRLGPQSAISRLPIIRAWKGWLSGMRRTTSLLSRGRRDGAWPDRVEEAIRRCDHAELEARRPAWWRCPSREREREEHGYRQPSARRSEPAAAARADALGPVLYSEEEPADHQVGRLLSRVRRSAGALFRAPGADQKIRADSRARRGMRGVSERTMPISASSRSLSRLSSRRLVSSRRQARNRWMRWDNMSVPFLHRGAGAAAFRLKIALRSPDAVAETTLTNVPRGVPMERVVMVGLLGSGRRLRVYAWPSVHQKIWRAGARENRLGPQCTISLVRIIPLSGRRGSCARLKGALRARAGSAAGRSNRSRWRSRESAGRGDRGRCALSPTDAGDEDRPR